MRADKIILNFCPTGMIPQKKVTPHVPVSVSEIVEQVHQAWELGITIAHLHAREDDGTPSWKPEIYRSIFEGVQKYCPGLVICASTSGRNVSDFEKRSAVIELKPDMCSLTLSSLNFVQGPSVNSPEMIVKLAEKMNKFGVNQELECFGLGMINFGKYLIKKRIVRNPAYWNLIFGNISGMQATKSHMSTATDDIPEGHFVAFGGLGNQQLIAHHYAIKKGYGIRIGLEDNLWMDDEKRVPASNISLLQRAHGMIKSNRKSVMNSTEFGNLGFYNQYRLDTKSNHATENSKNATLY